MITFHHLADALPAAMFGMFALWAAASKRHWFVRTAVVAAAILVTLLIPAYEVLVQLGIESLVVVAVIAIWRRRRRTTEPPNFTAASPFYVQLSLQTLLLTVVVVAVVTAVAARAPSFAANEWYGLVVTGMVAAAICLTSVWIVCGRTNLWIRLFVSPILGFILAVAMETLHRAPRIVRGWNGTTGGTFFQCLQGVAQEMWPGILYWLIATSIAMATLCAWLVAMRYAGWFDPFHAAAQPIMSQDTRKETVARVASLTLFSIVGIFSLALLYELLTPTPIPTVTLPDPNGFDDFVAAGQMIGPAAAAKLGAWDQLTETQLWAEVTKHAAAIDRMRSGLQKECWHPYVFAEWVPAEARALRGLIDALRGILASARGNTQEELANYKDLLRLAHAECRGAAVDPYSFLARFEWDAHVGIWSLRRELSAPTCIKLAAELLELDGRREPWVLRAQRQRIIDENSGWHRHVLLVLDDWSGVENFVSERNEHFRRVAELRILIVELGIRAYQLENGRMPPTLSALVPKYLPSIPDDPFGIAGIKFKLSDKEYMLYSVGPDGDDDGGVDLVDENGIENGDLTDVELFPRLPAGQKFVDVPETTIDVNDQP